MEFVICSLIMLELFLPAAILDLGDENEVFVATFHLLIGTCIACLMHLIVTSYLYRSLDGVFAALCVLLI
ncbi:uncharacterized protein J3R85_001859 [Psidium guajava]|nr:uncharacterized protein J3R85_001859 [Psidium guajava]